MTDAAGAAQGMRREFETMMRAQGERILRDMDVVQREEFEAVKEMAAKAREENEQLSARVAALEAEIAQRCKRLRPDANRAATSSATWRLSTELSRPASDPQLSPFVRSVPPPRPFWPWTIRTLGLQRSAGSV